MSATVLLDALAKTATDLLFGLEGFLVLLAIGAAFLILEGRRESRLPDREPEVVEDAEADWEWPMRRAGPVGRVRIDDRERRAA